jgi:hypothetical protein
MSIFFRWAFLILAGGFLFGMLAYVFYLGLKPNKKNPPQEISKVTPAPKSKVKL